MTVIIIMAVIRGALKFCHFDRNSKKQQQQRHQQQRYITICIETNAFNDNDIKFYIFGRSPKNYATSSSLCSATPRPNSFTLCTYTLYIMERIGMEQNECRRRCCRRWCSTRSVCLYFLGWCTTYISCVSVSKIERKRKTKTHIPHRTILEQVYTIP